MSKFKIKKNTMHFSKQYTGFIIQTFMLQYNWRVRAPIERVVGASTRYI